MQKLIEQKLMDKISAEQRHKNMAAIHSSNTKPERAVRSALHKIGFRFRKNDARLPGHPDIVLPRYKAVIFVNGCFWHGHVPFAVTKIITGKTKKLQKSAFRQARCTRYKVPKSNVNFWRHKIFRNRERDISQIKKLNADGWRVALVWECSITGRNSKIKIKAISEEISYWLEEDYSNFFIEF